MSDSMSLKDHLDFLNPILNEFNAFTSEHNPVDHDGQLTVYADRLQEAGHDDLAEMLRHVLPTENRLQKLHDGNVLARMQDILLELAETTATDFDVYIRHVNYGVLTLQLNATTADPNPPRLSCRLQQHLDRFIKQMEQTNSTYASFSFHVNERGAPSLSIPLVILPIFMAYLEHTLKQVRPNLQVQKQESTDQTLEPVT